MLYKTFFCGYDCKSNDFMERRRRFFEIACATPKRLSTARGERNAVKTKPSKKGSVTPSRKGIDVRH